MGKRQPRTTHAAADRPDAGSLPAGFSPVRAAAVTPQPHFSAAPTLAETMAGVVSAALPSDSHTVASRAQESYQAAGDDTADAVASSLEAAIGMGQPHRSAAASAGPAAVSAGQGKEPTAGIEPDAVFSPVEAAAVSPEPRFVAAPSLAAMAGLSTPDPWRGR